MIKVAPSILSADYVNLQRDIEMVEKGGAEYLHIDVMDGTFVPSISYGPGFVKAIRKVSDLFLDVHLMVEKPGHIIQEFAVFMSKQLNIFMVIFKRLIMLELSLKLLSTLVHQFQLFCLYFIWLIKYLL